MNVGVVKDGNGNVNPWGRGITPIQKEKIHSGRHYGRVETSLKVLR